MRGLPLVLLAGLAAGPAFAVGGGEAASDPLRLIEAGIFCPFEPGERIGAPDTMAGAISRVDQEMRPDLRSTRVPALRGYGFGIVVGAATGALPGDLRVVVEHPPLGPEGVTRQSWATAPTSAAPALDMFLFEEDWEIVQGRWTFNIVSGEETLLSQSFRVVPGEDAPEASAVCAEPPAIS